MQLALLLVFRAKKEKNLSYFLHELHLPLVWKTAT